jgi:hypothetical protein
MQELLSSHDLSQVDVRLVKVLSQLNIDLFNVPLLFTQSLTSFSHFFEFNVLDFDQTLFVTKLIQRFQAFTLYLLNRVGFISEL